MYVGDRLLKAGMRAIGLPAAPEEDGRGPPSGRLRVEEGLEPHSRGLLLGQLPLLHGGGVGEAKEQVPQLPGAMPK